MIELLWRHKKGNQQTELPQPPPANAVKIWKIFGHIVGKNCCSSDKNDTKREWYDMQTKTSQNISSAFLLETSGEASSRRLARDFRLKLWAVDLGAGRCDEADCFRAVLDPNSGGSRKFWWGGIWSTKPQKFGCLHQN